MSRPLEARLRTLLCEIRPRPGFATELLWSLTHDVQPLHGVGTTERRPRSRWVMAGALAGVVTATGAVYVAARRHQGGAA